jgi:anti-anti-sigma factor
MSQGNSGAKELDGAQFELLSERDAGGERITVRGEMDFSVIGDVDREMRRAEATDAARIVLELDELEFMDASGVRLLLSASERSQGNGGRLRITRAQSPQVQRVLELTGVGEVLPFAD